eukprot:UN05011
MTFWSRGKAGNGQITFQAPVKSLLNHQWHKKILNDGLLKMSNNVCNPVSLDDLEAERNIINHNLQKLKQITINYSKDLCN